MPDTSGDHDSPRSPGPSLALSNVTRAPASSLVALAVLLHAVVQRVAVEGAPQTFTGWAVLVLTTLASLLAMVSKDGSGTNGAGAMASNTK